jgi:hypothetical protein
MVIVASSPLESLEFVSNDSFCISQFIGSQTEMNSSISKNAVFPFEVNIDISYLWVFKKRFLLRRFGISKWRQSAGKMLTKIFFRFRYEMGLWRSEGLSSSKRGSAAVPMIVSHLRLPHFSRQRVQSTAMDLEPFFQ